METILLQDLPRRIFPKDRNFQKIPDSQKLVMGWLAIAGGISSYKIS